MKTNTGTIKHNRGRTQRFLLLCMLMLSLGGSLAQGQGAGPPKLRWESIDSKHFRVVYQKPYAAKAQILTNTLEHIYINVPTRLGLPLPNKIPILLHSQSMQANGFVTSFARRSELFTIAPQGYTYIGGNTLWMDILALHELQHVIQLSQIRRKMGYQYWLGGSLALSIGAFFFSNWYAEGDAVGIETLFSKGGRGRTPSFHMLFRTNLHERPRYNYEKARYGSFKDPVPNSYVFGYFLSTYLKRTYDPALIAQLYAPFLGFAVRRHTKKAMRVHYRDMMQGLMHTQDSLLHTLRPSPYTLRPLAQPPTLFTNYRYPVPYGDKIIALKRGLAHPATFVWLMPDGTEKSLLMPGLIMDNQYLTVGGDKLVWMEERFHPRWIKISYSRIKLLDLRTGVVEYLPRKEHDAGVALSPDGTQLITVNHSPEGDYALTLLDAADGQVRTRFDNPAGYFYSMPRFSDDGAYIVALRSSRHAKSIVRLHIATLQEEVLLHDEEENFGHPVLHGSFLFFNADHSGIDNVHVLDLDTRQRFMVTSSRYGSFNPAISADGKTIFYNEFTKDGYRVVHIPLDPSQWQALETVEDRGLRYYKPLLNTYGNPDILAYTPTKTYPTKPYKPHKNLVNIHSWVPFPPSVFSRDLMGIMPMHVGLVPYIDVHNKLNTFAQYRFSYQYFYPIVDFRLRVNDLFFTEEASFAERTTLEAGLRLPLLLTHSRFHEILSFKASAGLQLADPHQDSQTLFTTQILYSRLLKTSMRDIYPRNGARLLLSRQFATTGYGTASGQLLMLFPGAFDHHSFRLRAGFEPVHDAEDHFSAFSMPFVRGHTLAQRSPLLIGAVNYTLPLFYPDLLVPSIVYIKRVSLNVFFDYGVENIPGWYPLSQRETGVRKVFSLGAELFSIFYPIQILRVHVGVRVAYVSALKNIHLGLVFPFLTDPILAAP